MAVSSWGSLGATVGVQALNPSSRVGILQAVRGIVQQACNGQLLSSFIFCLFVCLFYMVHIISRN